MKFRVGNIVIAKDKHPKGFQWTCSIIKRFVVTSRSRNYITIDFLPGDKEINDVLGKFDGIPQSYSFDIAGRSFEENWFELESIGMYKPVNKTQKRKENYGIYLRNMQQSHQRKINS